MGIKRFFVRACGLCSLLALTITVASPTTASADDDEDRDRFGRVLLEDLSSPKGLATNQAGDLVVAQGAFGPPAPVLIYPLSGPDRGEPFPVTEPFSLIDVAVSPLDDTGWGLGPGELVDHVYLYHQLADGTVETVLDITVYQETDLDPVDQDDPPLPEESNPYGLTILPSGDALVADAAGNDVIRVSPTGEAFTVARFDLELVKTSHLGKDSGLPPKITAEAVPTTVTVGTDGAIYVGELKGFPFRPGSSKVWRIDPDAEGAWCSVRTPDPACTVYRDELTAIQDIAFSPTSGRLFVYELARDGVLAFEEGFDTGEFPPAVLLVVEKHRRHELAKGHLSEPGGITFGLGGLFVTDGVFSNGRLLRIHR